MKENKLIVTGCSVSDYTKVQYNYGELLSNRIGFEYLHLAAGCGSNHRSFREVTTRIREGKITTDDILIVQYTDILRREFWSKSNLLARTGHFISDVKATNLREPYGEGNTIKYKLDASQWQPKKVERDFFDTYENNFLNYEYELENFLNLHFSFMSVVKHYNLKCLFVVLEGYVLNGMTPESRKEFLSSLKEFGSTENISYINVTNILVDNIDLRLEKEDAAHYNQEGHQVLQNTVYGKLKELKWIK